MIYRNQDGRWAYPLFHAEATCPSRIVFVAEAPNTTDTFDADKGRLTVDDETDFTGRSMRALLRSVKLKPEEVLFTNTVLCLPAKQRDKFPVSTRLASACQPWLERFIEAADTRVVVTFGEKALKAMDRIEQHGLTLAVGVGRLHEWRGRKLLPLYHPSRLALRYRSREQQLADIRCLVSALG
jgi:uracil-DNA glycosylase family 4